MGIEVIAGKKPGLGNLVRVLNSVISNQHMSVNGHPICMSVTPRWQKGMFDMKRKDEERRADVECRMHFYADVGNDTYSICGFVHVEPMPVAWRG